MNSKENIEIDMIKTVNSNAMMYCFSVLLIIIITAAAAAVAVIPTPTVFAQESIVSVQTDDNHYDEGDTIVISGVVTTIISNTPVTLQVYFEGNIQDIAQITVAQDGSYSHTILAEGARWGNQGKYSVTVAYGKGNTAETVFTYSPKSEIITTSNHFEVSAGSHGTFDVDYTIVGGAVDNMEIEYSSLALKVEITATADEGSITLDLPRDFIGAENENGRDEIWIVLIDNIPVSYSESGLQEDSRIITISFEEGDSDILIIGTYVVPEFGTVAMMVILVIGVTATVLVLNSNNKFQIITKF